MVIRKMLFLLRTNLLAPQRIFIGLYITLPDIPIWPRTYIAWLMLRTISIALLNGEPLMHMRSVTSTFFGEISVMFDELFIKLTEVITIHMLKETGTGWNTALMNLNLA